MGVSGAERSSTASSGTSTRRTAGRKLDVGRNVEILDAALRVLSEVGYDAMTVDQVAARAGAARATVYRRWPTKADLAVDALRHLGLEDAGRGSPPDTGTLRGDLIAAIAPHDVEEQQFRIRVLTGMATLLRTDPRLAGEGIAAGMQPWIDSGRALFQRAVDREEFPGTRIDIDVISQVLPAMAANRAALQGLPVTPEFAVAVIDGVIMPAMRGATT